MISSKTLLEKNSSVKFKFGYMRATTKQKLTPRITVEADIIKKCWIKLSTQFAALRYKARAREMPDLLYFFLFLLFLRKFHLTLWH